MQYPFYSSFVFLLSPVSASGLGHSVAISSSPPPLLWLFSAQPWSAYSKTAEKITGKAYNNIKKLPFWMYVWLLYLPFRIKNIKRVSSWNLQVHYLSCPEHMFWEIVVKPEYIAYMVFCFQKCKASGGSHFESLRYLVTWAGCAAPPSPCSALSPSSVTAGLSVCGKRHKTAICVAWLQTHTHLKTLCWSQLSL